MLNVGTVQATAELNMRRFSQGMARMRKDGSSSSAHVERSLDGVGSKLRNIQFLASAALGSALVVGARRAVNEFALLEGAMAKFEVVFGDQSKMMEEWVETFRNRVPLARREIVQASAGFQDLIVPMGVARGEATKMTQEWMHLAFALSAFNDIPMEDALAKIRSGIAGQSRPLQELGIDARQTAVQQRALAMGLIEAGEEMSTQVRLQALLAQAYDNSSDALGGLDKQLDSTLLKEQELGAAFKDTLAIIGQGLQPAYNQLTTALAELFKTINTGANTATRRQQNLNDELDRARDILAQPIGERSFAGLQRALGIVNEQMDSLTSRENLSPAMEASLATLRDLAEQLGISLHEVAKTMTQTDNEASDLPKTVNDLNKEISDLKDNIGDSFDPEAIARYQYQIRALEIDVAKLTGTFENLKPVMDNIQPMTNLFDEDMFPPILSDLAYAEELIGDLIEGWDNLEDAPADFAENLTQATGAAQYFSRTLADGLDQILFRAQSVEDALKGIIRQLASRALVTGLMALFGGGLGGVSFGRAMFGGTFHTGGIVGGTGEKTIIAKGGEGVFTPAQMKAMGSSGGGSINLTVHVKGGTTFSANDLRYVIDEQIRQNVRLT